MQDRGGVQGTSHVNSATLLDASGAPNRSAVIRVSLEPGDARRRFGIAERLISFSL
jgi:hypothetical protein